MKRKTVKIIALIISLAMVASSACTVFAETGTEPEKTKEIETVMLGKSGTSSALSEKAISGMTDLSQNKLKDGIGFVTLSTGNELNSESYIEENTGYVEYGINSPSVYGSYKGYAQEVYIPAKGTVVMIMCAEDDSSSTGYVNFGVFKDAAMTQAVDSTGIVSSDGSTVRTHAFKVDKPGTYYLGVYSFINSASACQNFAVVSFAAYTKGTDRTLTSGKWTAVGQKDEQTNYFKFKATSTGYIKVEDSDRANVTLCSSSKKALSNENYNMYTPIYGVKKGNTYYIKVRSNYNYDGLYQLKVTNYKISENSGSKKSKAVTIKKGYTKKGTITAGSSQSDWYKFKLTSKKKVKITIKGGTNDKLKFIVYKGSKKVSTSTFYNSTKSITLNSVGKWSKGTYYIKAYRGTSKSSGWYSLKWQ